MFTRNRSGFTLVELLVVIAIIGMLVGILLPAVQGARNAGRRTQNSNNLKNLGLAIMSHAEAKGNLPPLRLVRPTGSKVPKSMRNYPDAEHSVSWAFELLPFIEQGNLYDQLDRSLPTTHPQQIVTQQLIPLFQNPGRGERQFAYDSDGRPAVSGPNGPLAQTLIDYAANRGVANMGFNNNDEFVMGYVDSKGNDRSQYAGPFVHNELVTTAHVKDGLSKTIAIADKWVPRSANGQYVDLNGLAGTAGRSLVGHSIMRGPSGILGGATYRLNEPLFPVGGDKPIEDKRLLNSELQRFGGATGGNMLAVSYLDGHVEWVDYSVDEAAFTSQCTMNGSDGLLSTGR